MQIFQKIKNFVPKSMRRGSFDMIATAAIGLLVAGIVVAISAEILDGFDFTADSYAANATENAEEANFNFSGWFDTIVTVVAAVIILGLVMMLKRQT